MNEKLDITTFEFVLQKLKNQNLQLIKLKTLFFSKIVVIILLELIMSIGTK
jgi:hypothetical protein